MGLKAPKLRSRVMMGKACDRGSNVNPLWKRQLMYHIWQSMCLCRLLVQLVMHCFRCCKQNPFGIMFTQPYFAYCFSTFTFCVWLTVSLYFTVHFCYPWPFGDLHLCLKVVKSSKPLIGTLVSKSNRIGVGGPALDSLLDWFIASSPTFQQTDYANSTSRGQLGAPLCR